MSKLWHSEGNFFLFHKHYFIMLSIIKFSMEQIIQRKNLKYYLVSKWLQFNFPHAKQVCQTWRMFTGKYMKWTPVGFIFYHTLTPWWQNKYLADKETWVSFRKRNKTNQPNTQTKPASHWVNCSWALCFQTKFYSQFITHRNSSMVVR